MNHETALMVTLAAVFSLVLAFQFFQAFPAPYLLADKKMETETTITIPVKAHIIHDTVSGVTSARTENEIIGLFGKANEIWSVAGIRFELDSVVNSDARYPIRYEFTASPNFDDTKVNVLFVSRLDEINGLSLPNYKMAFVADNTTVNDFRTLAHELGHLFGLSHVEDKARLMYSGSNGTYLTADEIATARSLAGRYLERGY